MLRLARPTLITTILLSLPVSVLAETPKLIGSSPLGIQRGKPAEVALRLSEAVDNPRLIAPFAFQLEETGSTASAPASWTFRLTIDARTAVGVYPVRVVTDAGVSNPILFAVGQVAQVAEVESNNTLALAQAIPNPAVVEGTCSGNDEDFFRFTGRKGDHVVVDAVCSRIGSGVDPMIRLTTADYRFLASADDTPGLFTDGYLTAVLPDDGEYFLEFCDSRFAGTGRAGYRLLVGSIPFAQEVYPLSLPRGQNVALELRGGTLSGDRLFALQTASEQALSVFYPKIPARLLGDPAWADSDLDVEIPTPILLDSGLTVNEPADGMQKLPPLSPPVTVLGRLSKNGERDEFAITAPAGSKYEVRVEAFGLGSALDGQLRVLGEDGRLLGETDDGKGAPVRRGGGGGGRARGPGTTDPAFDLTMPQGQNKVKVIVKDLMDRGGPGFTYRLVVTPIANSFQLALGEDQVAIPRGGTALVSVTVVRTGYYGPIELDLVGIPAASGLTIFRGTVPAGQTTGVVGLKAAAESAFHARELQVVGRAENGHAVVASKAIVFAEQTDSTRGFGMSGTIPSYARSFVSLTAAVAAPGPIGLDHVGPKLLVEQGSEVKVHLQVSRTVKETKKYRLAAVSPPPGLSVVETELSENGASATVTVAAKADAVPGRYLLCLVAQAAARGDTGGGRRAADAVTSKGQDSPRPVSPVVAAVMVAVEVVCPASPSKMPALPGH
jgi:hypothetical protein